MHKPLAIAFAVLAAEHRRRVGADLSDRSIKAVVPYPAGGPTDTVARTVTQGLAVDLGQSVIIEDQAGAGGRVAMKAVARATPTDTPCWSAAPTTTRSCWPSTRTSTSIR